VSGLKDQLAGLQRSTRSSSVADGEAKSLDLKKNKSALAAIHVEFQDQARRKCNIIVTGLAPSEGVPDRELFLEFCAKYLPIKPFVGEDNCRRLGKLIDGRIQPLLVKLRNDSAAEELLNCAALLRRVDCPVVRKTVYFNPDLTPAAAFAAYQQRVSRRQRPLSTSTSQSASTSTLQGASTSAPPPQHQPLRLTAGEFWPPLSTSPAGDQSTYCLQDIRTRQLHAFSTSSDSGLPVAPLSDVIPKATSPSSQSVDEPARHI